MNKKRNWAFVLYTESAPENWKEILIQSGVELAISPYHDKDKNPLGDDKKPHYHIILSYPGPTTFNNVKSLVVDKLGQPIPIYLESVKGYYRYFTHKDNPEKYQYDDHDIKLFNGFDVSSILNNTEVFQITKFVNSFIRENDLVEYSDLVDILQDNQFYEELNVVLTHPSYFKAYLDSRRYKKEKSNAKDTKTILQPTS